MRSVLYVQRDGQVLAGRRAINAYYAQNSGRPRKIVRQYVGQLEQVYSDGLRVAEDIFARIDELSPGRLLRSLKSELAGEYPGTVIFGRNYELEELIGIYLQQIRERVEEETGGEVEGVVLGRPINFVGEEEGAGNQRAEERLRDAAGRAGFRQVVFEFEPIAAALHYELSLAEPRNILVFDFGGGTLDVTVMRVGRDEERQVFATGGVGLAGDLFDQRIVEGLLLDHFGRGSTWSESSIPFPDQYTSALLNWQTIMSMHRPEDLHFLRQAQMTGSHPARVRALESLIVNDEGVLLFDRVEQAKISLSSDRFAIIHLDGEEIKVWQTMTRSQFEALIAQEIDRIKGVVLDVLGRSGLDAREIAAVVRTGGSAQIPAFIALLGELFGPEKVVLSDAFSGVTAGLAIKAHRYQ
jgi:hypothetical chaperone protein